MKWIDYKKPTLYTDKELNSLVDKLRVYVQDTYNESAWKNPESRDKIVQGWIHYYGNVEDFSYDEACMIIEDYTNHDIIKEQRKLHTEIQDLDNTELSEESEDFELRSPMGH